MGRNTELLIPTLPLFLSIYFSFFFLFYSAPPLPSNSSSPSNCIWRTFFLFLFFLLIYLFCIHRFYDGSALNLQIHPITTQVKRILKKSVFGRCRGEYFKFKSNTINFIIRYLISFILSFIQSFLHSFFFFLSIFDEEWYFKILNQCPN